MADVFFPVSWPGTPPVIAPGAYAGWYDSGARQWVFLWNDRAGVAELYVSTTGWTRRYPMEDGRLPPKIVLDGVGCGPIGGPRFCDFRRFES